MRQIYFMICDILKLWKTVVLFHIFIIEVTNYTDAKMIAELSEDLGEAMVGINESEIQILMAERGK